MLPNVGNTLYKPRMIRSFLTVSTGTLASRLLGFARDSMIAALLGAGPVADAFLVAFQLVNVVRRLLTEGALNAALVPAWLRVRETEGAVAAAAFAGRVLGTVSAALIVAAALIGLLMPLVIAALAPGFAGHPTLQLAVDECPADAALSRLRRAGHGDDGAVERARPLRADGVLAAAVQHRADRGHDRAARLAAGRRPSPRWSSPPPSASPGCCNCRSCCCAAAAGSIATPLRIAFDAPMRGFLGKAIPGMIASASPQLLVVAGAVIASSSPSAVSWLYFANRLIELPLGIVGVAMGTVLVPELTRALARRRSRPRSRMRESRGLELAVGLALPATLGLIVLSEPIVRMLFEHGVFTASDTAATAQALMWLALGLPAHVLVKALSPAFFARDDTLHAADGDAQGVCGRARSVRGARPDLRRRRHRGQHRARRLEQRARADPARCGDLRIFDRCRGAPAAAAHRRGGAGDGRAVVADGGGCCRRWPRTRMASRRPFCC